MQGNSNSSIQYLKPLKIKAPFSPSLKEFENDSKFNEYYRTHQEELDNMTTYQLNKSFKVPGYHISRMKCKEDPTKKELILTKEYYKPIDKLYEDFANDKDNKMAKEIVALKNEVEQLKNIIQVLVNDYNERNNLQ
jgi:hypothetical protein